MDPSTLPTPNPPPPNPVAVQQQGGVVQPTQTQLVPTEFPVDLATSTPLAQPVIQAATALSDQPISVAKGKESGPISSEMAGFVEMAGSDAIESEPLPTEVASWMEKVNRDSGEMRTPEISITPTQSGDVATSAPQQSVYVLPLGDDQLSKGKHAGVDSSVRWLAEWCGYLLKKLQGQAVLRQSQ